MINERYAKDYCCEDFSLIENYEKASKDLVEVWHLHHRKEEEGYSVKELIYLGSYYKRPACELIFLTKSEHLSLHKKGKRLSVKTKRKMSESKKGHIVTEECRDKISNSMKGEKNHNSKPVYQIDKNTGEIIKIWTCTMEVQRQLGIKNSNISQCCSGKRKSAGGFVWRYKQ